MNTSKILSIAMEVVGGLGIFLLGMRYMSDGMQAVAGERLRRLIKAVTDNRIIACVVGVLVTCFVQSSSITTVMVVGMVNATVMTLQQAVGVILGANIGTTITGWILVLKIGKYGLPMIGVGAFFYLFTRKDRVRNIAMLIVGLGMVFLGLELMKNGFKPIRKIPEFTEWFHAFSPDTFGGLIKTILAGAILTAIVQSSSATLGITIGLAVTGVITYDTAVALVLGENIGTTITARLASIGASDNARRASYAHVMVNVLGVLVMIMIFPWYLEFVKQLMGIDPNKTIIVDGAENFVDVTLGIASSHTIFNVFLALFYLPLLNPIVKLLYWMVPERKDEGLPHLQYLDIRLIEAPPLAIEQAREELEKMASYSLEMMGDLKTCWKTQGRKEDSENRIFEREKELDLMQKEINEFHSHLLQASASAEVVNTAQKHLRMVNELESIGDYVERILKFNLKMVALEERFHEEAKEEILDLHDHVARFIAGVEKALKDEANLDLAHMQVEADGITHLIKTYRAKHLARIDKQDPTPFKNMLYSDVLNAYRRIKDHAMNVVEAQAGEK